MQALARKKKWYIKKGKGKFWSLKSLESMSK